MFKRSIFILTIIATAASFAFAGEGDEDKDKKDSKKDEPKSIAKDSMDYYLDDYSIDSDDTLVYKDWDDNNGDGDDGGGSATVASLNQDQTSSGGTHSPQNFGQAAVDAWKRNVDNRYKVEFNIYPNPTANQINIRTISPANSIRIIDLLGNEVKVMEYTDNVDVTDLPIGTYFIQLIYLDHNESLKFIKSS